MNNKMESSLTSSQSIDRGGVGEDGSRSRKEETNKRERNALERT